MSFLNVNGVELHLVGHCGYTDEEAFGKSAPEGTGVTLFLREAGDEDFRSYIRIQNEEWSDKLEDLEYFEEWFEIKGRDVIRVDPARGFRKMK